MLQPLPGRLTTTLLCIFSLYLLGSCKKDPRPPIVAPAARDSLTFIVLGDWGENGSDTQKLVATQLIKYARNYNASFIISTGDNFYPAGVSSASDIQWQGSYEDVYPQDSLPIKWYVVLGNHDYMADPQAEIDYSMTSSRWIMPSRYYTLDKDLDSVSKVLFVFTDTSPFDEHSYNTSSDTSGITEQDTLEQKNWITNMLQTSSAMWKIVVGHHPLYSGGVHGDNATLINRLSTVFDANDVDYYIAGHDHNLEYLTHEGSDVQFLISGGGSKTHPIVSQEELIFGKASPGFLLMSLYKDESSFYFVDFEGNVLYRRTGKK
jgi:tartrate-resistant acid phosphatase type 5